MGIQGVWSMISQEPTRFGEQVVLLEADENTTMTKIRRTIYVDGPSLLYHLNQNPCYDAMPPSSDRAWSFDIHTCPSSIYRRATHFLQSLLRVSSQIMLVMDGLAPLEKQATQIERLQTTAQHCHEKMKNPTTKYNIPHLLSDYALVEAGRDLARKGCQVYVQEPSQGEAETWIQHHIQFHERTKGEDQHVLILSNDTDFLVYEFGFCSFQSLKFALTEEGKVSLRLFHYQSIKFWRANLPLQLLVQDDSDMGRCFTTVAALVGCDYCGDLRETDVALQSVRNFIVQSDIGGLRQKTRNKPTKVAILTAIVRYVSYHIRKSKTEWRNTLFTDLNPVARKAINNVEIDCVIKKIHCCYFPPEKSLLTQGGLHNSLSAPLLRLKTRKVFFCRPILEAWFDASATPQSQTTHRSHHGIKKRRKIRKTERNRSRSRNGTDRIPSSSIGVVERTNQNDNIHYNHNALVDDDQEMQAFLRRHSIWSLPWLIKLRRQALYGSLLNDDEMITEYNRSGNSPSIAFTGTQVSVDRKEGQFPPFIINSSGVDDSDSPPHHHFVLWMMNNLSPKTTFLFTLLLSCPLKSSPSSHPLDPSALADLFQLWQILSVTYFHVMLAMETYDQVKKGTPYSQPQTNSIPPVHRIFNFAYASWIVANIEKEDESRWKLWSLDFLADLEIPISDRESWQREASRYLSLMHIDSN